MFLSVVVAGWLIWVAIGTAGPPSSKPVPTRSPIVETRPTQTPRLIVRTAEVPVTVLATRVVTVLVDPELHATATALAAEYATRRAETTLTPRPTGTPRPTATPTATPTVPPFPMGGGTTGRTETGGG